LTEFEEFANIHVIKPRQALGRTPRFIPGIRMDSSTMQNTQKKVHTFLEKWLDKSIKQYVGAMDEQNNGHLHELIMGGIEKPLVEIVLKETNGNQTQAANILGINRNTLRKKIAEYEIKCKSKT
jgi:Fis family transcriptional regulator, factor for inversion stimulation protein